MPVCHPADRSFTQINRGVQRTAFARSQPSSHRDNFAVTERSLRNATVRTIDIDIPDTVRYAARRSFRSHDSARVICSRATVSRGMHVNIMKVCHVVVKHERPRTLERRGRSDVYELNIESAFMACARARGRATGTRTIDGIPMAFTLSIELAPH